MLAWTASLQLDSNFYVRLGQNVSFSFKHNLQIILKFNAHSKISFENFRCISNKNEIFSLNNEIKKISHTGSWTRACWVKASYPSR